MIQLSGSLLSISVPPGIHELVRARSPLDGPEFLRRVCRESEVLVVGANGAQFVVLRVSAIHVPFNSPLVSLVPFPSRGAQHRIDAHLGHDVNFDLGCFRS